MKLLRNLLGAQLTGLERRARCGTATCPWRSGSGPLRPIRAKPRRRTTRAPTRPNKPVRPLSASSSQGPPPASHLERHYPTPANEGTPEQPVTWLFEPESLTPAAKLLGEHRYSVLTDHFGVPTTMADAPGRVIWQAEIRIWGDLRKVRVA